MEVHRIETSLLHLELGQNAKITAYSLRGLTVQIECLASRINIWYAWFVVFVLAAIECSAVLFSSNNIYNTWHSGVAQFCYTDIHVNV